MHFAGSICAAGKLHRSFAAKRAAQDDNRNRGVGFRGVKLRGVELR